VIPVGVLNSLGGSADEGNEVVLSSASQAGPVRESVQAGVLEQHQ